MSGTDVGADAAPTPPTAAFPWPPQPAPLTVAWYEVVLWSQNVRTPGVKACSPQSSLSRKTRRSILDVFTPTVDRDPQRRGAHAGALRGRF